MACETNAKASANSTVMPVLREDPKFELRTRAYVTKLNYDKAAKKVTGVLYTDLRTGEEYEQPASIVVLSSFVFGNTQQLLLSGIGEAYDPVTGKGLVGKNYGYQFEAGAEAFFEDKEMNPFFGNAGMGVCIDDFNGENFDHSVSASSAAATSLPARPAHRRSRAARCRTARRPGAPNGSARR
jgi:gluconate 2-dehydrogenase alpha chain